jgi:hypothetical protein
VDLTRQSGCTRKKDADHEKSSGLIRAFVAFRKCDPCCIIGLGLLFAASGSWVAP